MKNARNPNNYSTCLNKVLANSMSTLVGTEVASYLQKFILIKYTVRSDNLYSFCLCEQRNQNRKHKQHVILYKRIRHKHKSHCVIMK